MSPQADGVVSNGTGSAVRSDINNQYAALWSNHSGSTEPSSGKVAYQFWADTNTNILKIRNSANNAWISLFTLAGGIDVDAASNFNEDVTFTGASSKNAVWDKSDGALEFADDTKAVFGNGSDLQIWHDAGAGSNIRCAGTKLEVRSDLLNLQSSSAEKYLLCTANGAVEAYYDNIKKVELRSDGLQVDGTVRLPSDSSKILLGAGLDLELFHDGGDSWIKDVGGGRLWISTNLLQVIDTTTNETMFKCTENGAIDAYYDNTLRFQTNSSGTRCFGTAYHEEGGIMATYAHTGTGESIRFRANTSSTVGNITVGASSTTYNTSSDYRLKENEVAISDGITRLKTLKPYRFNFKTDPNTTLDGFFAHEVTAVPESVTGEKDGEEMQGMDYGRMSPLLTAALQEAITKIESLEEKVAVLEAN